MDPDCAICHAPATLACDCEAKGLEVAVRQAEARMMQSIYNDIRSAAPQIPLTGLCSAGATVANPVCRSWVRAHAQDYILEYFRLLTERRKTAHTAHLDRITRSRLPLLPRTAAPQRDCRRPGAAEARH